MFVDKATKERLHEIREAIKKYGFDKILGQTAKNKIQTVFALDSHSTEEMESRYNVKVEI